MIIDEIRWNESRVEHILRHGIRPAEVEEVCFGEPFIQSARNGRYVVYGQTTAGRYLMVALSPLGNMVFDPITSREMTEMERRCYRQKGK